MGPLVEFTASGSPKRLSSAIEALAAERRVVTALVVPWESSETTLCMAVTLSKSDGWAIEHTNLGTVSLGDLGNGETRITVSAARDTAASDESTDQTSPVGDKPRALLAAFARQIEQKLKPALETSRDNPPAILR